MLVHDSTQMPSGVRIYCYTVIGLIIKWTCRLCSERSNCPHCIDSGGWQDCQVLMRPLSFFYLFRHVWFGPVLSGPCRIEGGVATHLYGYSEVAYGSQACAYIIEYASSDGELSVNVTSRDIGNCWATSQKPEALLDFWNEVVAYTRPRPILSCGPCSFRENAVECRGSINMAGGRDTSRIGRV